jgi:hypothetical protein
VVDDYKLESTAIAECAQLGVEVWATDLAYGPRRYVVAIESRLQMISNLGRLLDLVEALKRTKAPL